MSIRSVDDVIALVREGNADSAAANFLTLCRERPEDAVTLLPHVRHFMGMHTGQAFPPARLVVRGVRMLAQAHRGLGPLVAHRYDEGLPPLHSLWPEAINATIALIGMPGFAQATHARNARTNVPPSPTPSPAPASSNQRDYPGRVLAPTRTWSELYARRGVRAAPAVRSRFDNYAERSALKLFGYSVGRNAPDDADRRALLEEFMYTELPRQWPHVEDWYPAATRARRDKTIGFIRWRADYAARQAGDYSIAIDEWTGDAAWLEARFR